jgi:hypothetical protein
MPSKFRFWDVMEGGGCVSYGRGRGKLGWHLSWRGSDGWMVQWHRQLPEEEDEQHWVYWDEKAKLGLEASWAEAAGIKGEKE